MLVIDNKIIEKESLFHLVLKDSRWKSGLVVPNSTHDRKVMGSNLIQY